MGIRVRRGARGAGLFRVGKTLLEVLGDGGVQMADGSGGTAAHGREGTCRGCSGEGRPSRPLQPCQVGSAMAIGLLAALTRDIECDVGEMGHGLVSGRKVSGQLPVG